MASCSTREIIELGQLVMASALAALAKVKIRYQYKFYLSKILALTSHVCKV